MGVLSPAALVRRARAAGLAVATDGKGSLRVQGPHSCAQLALALGERKAEVLAVLEAEAQAPPVPAFRCALCDWKIGRQAKHWVLADRRVICEKCLDRHDLRGKARHGNRNVAALYLGCHPVVRLGPPAPPGHACRAGPGHAHQGRPGHRAEPARAKGWPAEQAR
jgi:hypothetical protein